MMRGTLHNAQTDQRQSMTPNMLNESDGLSSSQQRSYADGCESTTELNNYLDKYLKNLGHCAKKRHLHWSI